MALLAVATGAAARAGLARSIFRRFGAIAAAWRTWINDLRELLWAPLHDVVHGLFNPYRPELHYMRGPGPKWREKHARADR